jgi:uncharacterized damage-inducible protein DinB
MLNSYSKKIALFLAIMLCTAGNYSAFAQQDDFIKDYLQRLEQSKEYLILVAEAMPDDQYGFKASQASMTFAENLMHICWAMDWHCQSLLGGRPARDWKTDTELKVDAKSKEEMIATVEKTFNETIKFISGFDTKQFNDQLDYLGLERTKRQIFLLLSDHITHHRAQMIVYLRLNDIQPPRYILYQ